MVSFKELEDSFKNFLIQEQSDAHSLKSLNLAKYNNIKLWMDQSHYNQPHFYVRISISEAVFSLEDGGKLNGGLGYEERFVLKWFKRMGIKSKLTELWNNIEKVKEEQ